MLPPISSYKSFMNYYKIVLFKFLILLINLHDNFALNNLVMNFKPYNSKET